MATQEFRGHIAEYGLDGIWKYSDTKEIVDYTNSRPCKHCGRKPTSEGHDACLGTLPNVEFACCGHQGKSKPYAKFINGTILDFENQEEMYKFFNIE